MATMVLGQEMARTDERHSLRQAAAPRLTTAERDARNNTERFAAQQALRRGPTPEMFFAKHIDNSRMVKADDPDRKREMRNFTGMMAVFFLLTMVYVLQHLSAIEVGYNVEAQKQQVEQLREENRQLRLSEAELSDPGRIAPIARQLGLDAPDPGQVVRQDGAGAGVVMAMVR